MKKKILLAMEGDRFSYSTLKYGIEIARNTQSLLVAVFMRDLKYAGYSYPVMFDQPFVDASIYTHFLEEEKVKIEANVKIFRDECTKEGITHKVHLNEQAPIEGIIHESAYADLIIMDAEMNVSSLLPDNPSSTLRDILIDAHCPIIVVPEKYEPITNTILSYDGSHSSTFAIKMFNYIFPEWREHKTFLLSINDHKGNHLKENTNIREFMGRHYTDVVYEILTGEAHHEMRKFLKYNHTNSIMVMGSYGRNALSRLLRQSMANMIIRDTKIPVFISHQ